ncbi:MAG: copper chaperone PCu(A)C [Candidatus Kryptoniota bacterium]
MQQWIRQIAESCNFETANNRGWRLINPTIHNFAIPALLLLVLLVIGFRPPVSGIKVENVYVRVASRGMTSAAYFTIVNSSEMPDTLYDVNADFTEMAMLHETVRNNGMVGMKEVDFVVVPARDSIDFKPGGFHIMLMDVKQDLKVGASVNFELFFRHEGMVKVKAVVKK